MSDDAGEHDDPRRRRLLDAALGVFSRYGFRKTSMEEVARAADLSRQALYLRYASKEALFVATFEHVLTTALEAARASLEDENRGLEARLLGAFDAWVGRFVGAFDGEARDMLEAGSALAGASAGAYEANFVEAVTRAVRGAGLAAAYQLPGLTARQLATTMYAAARGLKYESKTREAFGEQLALALRVLCAPGRGARKSG